MRARNRREGSHRSAKNPLREVIHEVAGPRPGRVAFVVDVPDVRHVALLEVDVDTLRDVDEPVLVAAGQVEELQLGLRRGRIRHELGRRPGVRSGGERANPRKGRCCRCPSPKLRVCPPPIERPARARCSRSVSAAYFFSIAGIRLSSRSRSNLAKPASFSGANWLPVALSSASARPLGDHDNHRHRDVVGDQVVKEGVRRREADTIPSRRRRYRAAGRARDYPCRSRTRAADRRSLCAACR